MDEKKKDERPESKTESVTSALEERPRWRHLFAFTTRKHLHCLLGASLSSVAVAALRTALAITLGRVFDIVAALGNGTKTGPEALSQVSRYCIILTALGAAQWLANSTFLALWITFGELQASNVRRTLFRGLVRMEKTWMDSLPDGTSGVVASIQRKTHELQIAASQVFGYLVTDILAAVASLAVALYTSWKLALVLLASVPVSFVVLALSGRRIEPAAKSQASHLNTASKILTGSIGGIDLVKIYNGYASETQAYMASIGRAAKQYRLQAKYNSIQIGYTNFWAIGLFAAGFWYGLALVQKGESPGKVFTTFYAVLSALQGVEPLLPNWLVFEKGMSAGQVLQALATEVAASSNNGSDLIRPGYFVGAIDFKEVSFSYPTTPLIPSLDRCTLSISAGDITFLVGRSGSGKSTVANLMTRTYDTLEDSIYVDGFPIKCFDHDWIRQRIVLVEQTPVIFNDTLFRNIVLGHPDPNSVSSQQVLDACRIFGLESTIAALVGGLYAMIGGKGCPLSGGQRQRIALARAYLRDPAILILDEPNSALDQNSREAIMKEIRKWRRGKTTIIICHDFERIKGDDFVYVLDKGAVSEFGFKRDIEASPFTACLSTPMPMPMAQDDVEKGPWIEINVVSPIDQIDKEGSLHQRQRSSQTWLSSRSNSSVYSDASLLSPGFSRNSECHGSANPRHSVRPCTAATRMSQIQTPSRISSFMNRRFEPIDGRNNLEFTESIVFQNPMYTAHDTSSAASDIAEAKRDKSSRRRLVELGVLQNKPQDGHGISYIEILQTVVPALSPMAVAKLGTGIFMTIVGALSTPAFSFCLARLLAVMWSFGDKSAEGRKWALYLVVVGVVDGLCSGIGRYFLESTAQSWVDSVRCTALNDALRQPKSWFMDEQQSNARIVEAFDVHGEEMRNTAGRFLFIIISVATMVSVSVVWAFITCWRLTLVALAPLPLMAAALKAYSYLGDKWETRCAIEAEQTGSILNEVLAAMRTVRNYGLEKHFSTKYAQAAQNCRRSGFKKAWYSCPLFGFYQSFSFGNMALLFYYGTSLLVKEQALPVASVLQVMNLLLFSIGSSTQLLSAIPQLTMAIASASRMLAYTKLKGSEVQPELESQGGRASPLPVRMRNVAFASAGDEGNMILRDVSLDIMPGRCTAIVGLSGSGKSTVLSLILGLQLPQSQYSLTYADTPCSMMDPRQLRATIGYVPQTAFLFPTTIAENIAYGLDKLSALRHVCNIRAAAREAGIDDYIASLPEGYNTVVGEGGQTLSGGQAQRITIARALVRRPALLVLDEPTSALDAESAEVVRDCVADLVAQWKAERRQAAVVMVTHNVEMMRVADRIIVVENGQDVEEGAFEDLWFSGDAFRRLVRQREEVDKL